MAGDSVELCSNQDAHSAPRGAPAASSHLCSVPCVALFDFDDVGSEQNRQLKEWNYATMTLPREAFALGNAGLDHVRCVVEIEDMLPLEVVKEFFRQHQDRRPELVIAIPSTSKERWVVDKQDKLAFAEWVVSTQPAAPASALCAVCCALFAVRCLRRAGRTSGSKIVIHHDVSIT